MAKLQPFFAPGTRAGSKEAIDVKLGMIWPKVGEGKFTGMSDYDVSFSGQIKTIPYTGPLNFSLTLSDRSPGALHGAASITLNDAHDPHGKYEVDGRKLVVTAASGNKLERIEIHPADKGTYIELFGEISRSIFLKPE